MFQQFLFLFTNLKEIEKTEEKKENLQKNLPRKKESYQPPTPRKRSPLSEAIHKKYGKKHID